MEKETTKISLSVLLLILALIIIIIMSYLIYKLYNEKTIEIEKVSNLNNQISNLENTVSNLQEKINLILNTTTNLEHTANNNIQNKTENSSVSYIILEIEDIKAEEKNQQGLEYKNMKITDKEKIDSLMEIIDNAIPYEEETFIADFGDIPPCAKIYLSNGESYTVAAGDQIDDNGNIVNLMTKWSSEDGSNKTLYKLNNKLGEQIEKMFDE